MKHIKPAPRKRQPKPKEPAAPVAPQPALDIAALLSAQASLKDFADLSEHHMNELATFARILKRNAGCNTPAEEFICGLMLHYQHQDAKGIGLTPDDVEWELSTFRENFDSAVEDAQFIASRYPQTGGAL